MNEIKKSVFSGDVTAFEHAQRSAGALAKSDLVPKEYKNNVANCLIALDMAGNMNLSPLIVMQNLHIIHGRPSWSSKFLISVIKSSPRFSKVEFIRTGKDTDNKGCYVQAFDNELGKVVHGTHVDMKMANAEGWVNKTGSKWKTMPDLMLMYRAGAFFARIHAPELTMGILTSEENRDIPQVTEDAEIIEDINNPGETEIT